jgi:hypothetical protein
MGENSASINKLAEVARGERAVPAEPRRSDRDLPAPTFGRYRMLRELGRGAMGRVFLAHDPQLDRAVAIKTVLIFASLPVAEQERARQRFLREARAAAKLLHPGIVTVFDVGEADGVPYLAMEPVEGVTLDAFCRGENLLPLGTAVEIIARAAEALDYAHRAGIVHRDVKPANLMRVGETSVKIMDFGLARSAETQLTHDGALLGTPSYMSPEQIRGGQLDGRSDLFSLAVVLYELLTGDKAFAGDSVSSILYRVVHEEPRDASEVHGRVPRPLAGFLKTALAKAADLRFPTGSAFAEALRGAAAGLAAPAASAALVSESPEAGIPEPAVRSPRPRSSRALVVAVSLLGVVAGAVAYRFRQDIGSFLRPAPRQVWLETVIRTDPPGLPVTLDDAPLGRPVVRFPAEGPFGVLRVTQGCRTVEHVLGADDAGREIVLVPDPVRAEVTIDPPVSGAKIRFNGSEIPGSPARVALDLCVDNRIELLAPGYRPARVDLPAGTTPLEARTALAGLQMEQIPRGRVILPDPSVSPVRFYVDGREVKPSPEGVELLEGEHELRVLSEPLWIDVTQLVEVRGGETRRAAVELPDLAELVVQAFPANCQVFLRRKGGAWKYVDDVPVRRQIAAGRYDVKVVLRPSGQERSREIELTPGPNPPLRFSFARRS